MAAAFDVFLNQIEGTRIGRRDVPRFDEDQFEQRVDIALGRRERHPDLVELLALAFGDFQRAAAGAFALDQFLRLRGGQGADAFLCRHSHPGSAGMGAEYSGSGRECTARRG